MIWRRCVLPLGSASFCSSDVGYRDLLSSPLKELCNRVFMYKGCLLGDVWACNGRLGHPEAESIQLQWKFLNLILGALVVDAKDPENRFS